MKTILKRINSYKRMYFLNWLEFTMTFGVKPMIRGECLII